MSRSPDSDVAVFYDALEDLLSGGERSRILREVAGDGSTAEAMGRLRVLMSTHAMSDAATAAGLPGVIRRLDGRTRKDGFHALHSWDHRKHEFTQDIVPVLMLDFLARFRTSEQGAHLDPSAVDMVTLGILLDYYFLHLLALGAMRAWDAPDPDAAMGRVTELIGHLQGPSGSGHHFLSDAETLLIYALSQFHPEEQAYDRIIARVATLSESRQTAFACVSAAVLSAHLRWGFWLMYGRDVVRMRADNVGDYPWLLNSVLTLLRAYDRLVSEGGDSGAGDRDMVTGALLQGLAADPWAFFRSAPPALRDFEGPYMEARTLLDAHGPTLLADFEAARPDKASYFPLALHFNFPHNALVATVTLALLEGRPQPLPFNDLLLARRPDPSGDGGREELARALMAFSRGSPDRLGYQGAMLVAYDPLSGLRSWSIATDALRKALA